MHHVLLSGVNMVHCDRNMCLQDAVGGIYAAKTPNIIVRRLQIVFKKVGMKKIL